MLESIHIGRKAVGAQAHSRVADSGRTQREKKSCVTPTILFHGDEGVERRDEVFSLRAERRH